MVWPLLLATQYTNSQTDQQKRSTHTFDSLIRNNSL